MSQQESTPAVRGSLTESQRAELALFGLDLSASTSRRGGVTSPQPWAAATATLRSPANGSETAAICNASAVPGEGSTHAAVRGAVTINSVAAITDAPQTHAAARIATLRPSGTELRAT